MREGGWRAASTSIFSAVLSRQHVLSAPPNTTQMLCSSLCCHQSPSIGRAKGTVSEQGPSRPRRYLQECGSKPVHVPLQRKHGTPLPDCGWLTDIWKRTGHQSWLYSHRLCETRALTLFCPSDVDFFSHACEVSNLLNDI